MIDKFMFSKGQDLGSLDSTGGVSTNIWDLEEDVTVDQMFEGWIHIIILTCTQDSGNEGLDIRFQNSDNVDITTSARVLAGTRLVEAELVAGNRFSFGFSKAKLLKYVGVWYAAVSSSLNNATTIDSFFTYGPIQSPDIQSQKRPS